MIRILKATAATAGFIAGPAVILLFVLHFPRAGAALFIIGLVGLLWWGCYSHFNPED